MKFKIIQALLAVFSSLAVFGQSSTILETHYLRPVIINPATAGSEYYPVVDLASGKKWLGIENSSSTQILSTSLRMGNFDFYNPKMYLNKTDFKAKERVGFGAYIFNYSNGPELNQGALLAYAYHLPLKYSNLSFGLSVSYERKSLRTEMLVPLNPFDPVLTREFLPLNYLSFNFGAFYYDRKWFIGLSANELYKVSNDRANKQYKNQDIALTVGGSVFKYDKIIIEPSINAFLIDLKHFRSDLNIKLYYNYVHWIVFSIRTNYTAGLKFGYKIRNFYVAYEYDLTLTKIIRFNTGNHMLNLGVNLGTRLTDKFY